MTDHNITPAAPILVAIDISKHRHEILIEVPGKKRRRRLTIQNTREDYQRPQRDHRVALPLRAAWVSYCAVEGPTPCKYDKFSWR